MSMPTPPPPPPAEGRIWKRVLVQVLFFCAFLQGERTRLIQFEGGGQKTGVLR